MRSGLAVALIGAACLTAPGAVASATGSAVPALPLQAAVPAPKSLDRDGIVTTRHRIELAGRTLDYTARAGRLPIRDNATGEPHGHVFFIAYTVEPPTPRAPRPLTFLWNGGPGANSVLVHLEGFGPRRFGSPRSSRSPTIPLEDNQATWLDETDLVFVDPIGTGYSRPTSREHEPWFYSTRGDIASVAEFVRVYLTRFDAWDAPLFVGGESYGAWRAGGVAETLERRGIRVSGVLLVSGGIPFGPVVSDEMRAALFIPTRTAAALHHGKLEPALQRDPDATLRRVQAWALDVYGPALASRATLDRDRRAALVGELARFTGLDPALIDADSLVVRRQHFAEALLRDRDLVLGRFDAREAMPSGPEAASVDGARARTVVRYLREDLGFETDLAYQGLEIGYTPPDQEPALPPGPRWNYDHERAVQAVSGAAPETPFRRLVYEGPPGGSDPWLRRAMALNPSMQAFVAAGLYDSLNSCAFNEYLVGRLEPELAANVTTHCYVGGHMMYRDEQTRAPLKRDVTAFLRGAR